MNYDLFYTLICILYIILNIIYYYIKIHVRHENIFVYIICYRTWVHNMKRTRQVKVSRILISRYQAGTYLLQWQYKHNINKIYIYILFLY